jgi:hypothetical protein
MFTETEVYSWGLNAGQLGILQTFNSLVQHVFSTGIKLLNTSLKTIVLQLIASQSILKMQEIPETSTERGAYHFPGWTDRRTIVVLSYS